MLRVGVYGYGLELEFRVRVQGYGLAFTHTYIAGTLWDVAGSPKTRTVHGSPGHSSSS